MNLCDKERQLGIFVGYVGHSEDAVGSALRMLRAIPHVEQLAAKKVHGESFAFIWQGVAGFGGISQTIFENNENAISVCLDGYLDNYWELAHELGWIGSCSDVELIAFGFRRLGTSLLFRLKGSFALAVFDKRSHSLYLVRDLIGSVPLFFGKNISGDFAFASLPIAVCKGLKNSFELSKTNVRREILGLGTQAPTTLFVNVSSVEPGTILCFNNGGSSATVYGELSDLIVDDARDIELVELMREGISNGVSGFSSRTSAPIAVALSGGLDSSVVLGAACQNSELKERICAISALVAGKAEGDREYAEQVVKKHGVRWSFFRSKAIDIPDELLMSATNPIAVSHLSMAWEVFGTALAEGCRAVLTGVAGDVVGGLAWEWQASMLVNRQIRMLVQELLVEGVTITRLPRSILGIAFQVASYRFTKGRIGKVEEAQRLRYKLDLIGATGSQRRELEDEWWYQRSLRRSPFIPFTRRLIGILRNYVASELESAGVVARALGLEIGCPLVHEKVISAAISLPIHLRRRNGLNRVALREAADPWIPKSLKSRRKKLDFTDHILPTWRKVIRESSTLCNLDRLAEFVDAGAWLKFCAVRAEPSEYMMSSLYEVAVLERWLRLNVDCVPGNEF